MQNSVIKNRVDYLSKENVLALKGIFAVFVVFTHLNGWGGLFPSSVIGAVLDASGFLSVGIFFFLSGYGMMAQMETDAETYLNGFPRRRLMWLYSTYVLTIIVYLIYFILCEEVPERADVIQSFFWGKTIVLNGWYLQAILVMYVLFYVFHRINFKYPNILSAIIYVTVCFVSISDPAIYIQSALCFYWGILWKKKKTTVDSILNKRYFCMLAVSFVLFCISLVLGYEYSMSGTIRLCMKTISAVVFTVFVLSIVYKVRISWRMTSFLGTISYELYLFHGIFLHFFRKVGLIEVSKWLYAGCVLVVAILFSWIIHHLFVRVRYAILN